MENFGSISSFFIPVKYENNKIEFKLYEDIPKDENLVLVAYDVSTGMKRDVLFLNGKSKSDNFYYWWTPSPGSDDNLKYDLGDIILHLNHNDKTVREFYLNRGGLGKPLIVNGLEIKYPKTRDNIYNTFWEIFIGQEYEYCTKLGLNSESTVIDIGSNYGLFSLFIIDKYNPKKVIGVEPNYECFTISNEVLKDFKNFKSFNYAISKSIGNFSLKNHTGETVLGEIVEDFNGEIQGVDINTFLEGINDNIDLIKIDCEGCERFIFETISEKTIKNIKNIILEYHSNEIKNLILEKLNFFGFKSEVSESDDGVGIILAKNNI